MQFLSYTTKPVVRQAFQITDAHLLAHLEGAANTFLIGDHITNMSIKFKAHAPIQVGDWIIRITEEDTYHCPASVFQEHYLVP